MAYLISRQDHQRGWTADFSNDPFLSDQDHTAVMYALTEKVRFESGGGSASVEKWAPRDIRVRLRCERESTLLFHQFYDPGWHASLATPLEASSQGLIRAKAPAGEYELRLWLDGGRMETIGKWISALS